LRLKTDPFINAPHYRLFPRRQGVLTLSIPR